MALTRLAPEAVSSVHASSHLSCQHGPGVGHCCTLDDFLPIPAPL